MSLVGVLPPDLDAAVFVVLHVAASSRSVLAEILARAGLVPAAPARPDDQIVAGRILVAPPDHHLLLDAGGVRLDHGPKENGHRPSVDALFRSAAAAFGPRVVGVVLSGSRDDGSAGLAAIKAAGGVAMAQSLEDALYPSMPRSASEHVDLDVVGSARELGLVIAAPERRPAGGGTPVATHPDPPPPVSGGGDATGLTCPECGGALWERPEEGVSRFACHVGHRYSEESLLAEHGETLEAALWTAVRALMERAGLLRRLAEQVRAGPASMSHRRFEAAANEAEQHAVTIRDGILAASSDARETA
ncbi:MAG: chemotaxis protein CheB [Solirubrobacterales bacterium]|nr:chemotaxis protein CheB [Solirubrobacterales bacterium]